MLERTKVKMLAIWDDERIEPDSLYSSDALNTLHQIRAARGPKTDGGRCPSLYSHVVHPPAYGSFFLTTSDPSDTGPRTLLRSHSPTWLHFQVRTTPNVLPSIGGQDWDLLLDSSEKKRLSPTYTYIVSTSHVTEE